MNPPLVSVVTPFYNTARYLAECIESVLAQTYPHFEYILVDNCSTDGSGEIAEVYAARDPRIRLLQRSQLLSQVQNYNRALEEISGESQFTKIVQADDFIFPECLQAMVQAFHQAESIGLVSAYDLKGNIVRGSGFPYRKGLIPGKEVAKLYLLKGTFVFGSPTTVMYRSSLIRDCGPFYDESLLHEDTDKCMQILRHWDFGFVHQVLSFLRTDNDSISSAVRGFQPDAVDRYIIVQRYASAFLDAGEAAALRRNSKKGYYGLLAKEALRFRDSAFWHYHQTGLSTIDERLDWHYLTGEISRLLVRMATNPGATIMRAFRYVKCRIHRKRLANTFRSSETARCLQYKQGVPVESNSPGIVGTFKQSRVD